MADDDRQNRIRPADRIDTRMAEVSEEDDELRQSLFSRIRSNTTFLRFVGLIVVLLLLVMEVVIIVQLSPSRLFSEETTAPIIIIVVCSLVLDALCVMDIYIAFGMKTRIVVYTMEYLMLFVVCLMGGTVYISVLMCIVLTQMYIALPRLRDQIILLCVAAVLYVVSFIISGYVRDIDVNVVTSFVGDAFLGVLILLAHFSVENAILWLYRLNKRLSASLKAEEESREELKDVYRQLSESAVYEERNRIAGDIHDNVGHAITTVIMQTEAAKKLMDKDPENAKKAITSANVQARNALEQMRDSIHLLAGREDKVTIKSAVEETFYKTMDGTDIKIMSDIDEIAVGDMQYRIIDNAVKEALSNGMRHGGATAFYVELKREGDTDRLLVSDNGRGLSSGYTEGYGLRRMRLSCEAIGAEMKMESVDGEGCELTLRLPVKTVKVGGET
ncbi:MAG: sensor histidine kinase [Clostridia bacterium]|nr:sensor histidine kinase [Clostridia bacterium]